MGLVHPASTSTVVVTSVLIPVRMPGIRVVPIVRYRRGLIYPVDEAGVECVERPTKPVKPA
jgi:hypothetical protein